MVGTMILGAGGQLGRELCRIYPDALAVYHKTESDKIVVDLNDADAVTRLIHEVSPDIVVNAAAIANVDLCEKDHKLAYSVNGTAVDHVAKACRSAGAYMVHVSTDYVFDGAEGMYNEESPPNPINYYGLSKLIGDIHALSYENSCVVRTSGVFGSAKNFPVFVLETLMAEKEVKAIAGYYSPIHARNLAKAISELTRNKRTGLINVAGEKISRFGLATSIAKEFSLDTSLVSEVGDLHSLNAKRPFDSSLDSSVAVKELSFDFHSTASNLGLMKRIHLEKEKGS